MLSDDVANPALDASTATGTDARGEERGFDQTFIDNGGLSDLGAFELAVQASGGEPPSLVVTTADDSFDPTDNQTSLREAVAYVNYKDGPDTITFAPSGQGLIRLTRGEIGITDELTIEGGGLVTITGDAGADDLDANGNLASSSGGVTDVAQSVDSDTLGDNSRVFDATADLTLTGLTVTGGRTEGNDQRGGGVEANGDLTLIDSLIAGNSTSGIAFKGGGIYSNATTLIQNSTVSGNSTFGNNGYGGGIYSFEVIVENSTISNNSTYGSVADGCGINTIIATITNSTISGNKTTGSSDGGGLHVRRSATIENSTISGNMTEGSSARGGGVYGYLADIRTLNSTISGNSTLGVNAAGGGVYALDSELIVENSIILGNVAQQADHDEQVEIFEQVGFFADNDGLIELTGANIIGANGAAFDVTAPTTGSGSAINADAASVFTVTRANNGVVAGLLDDNGAPIQTIALRDGLDNPALDTATIAGLVDARGEARGVDLIGVDNGGTSDLGAYELQIDEDFTFPVITRNLAISLAEGASAGLSFFPVTATDLTADHFEIFSGTDADKVSINATTGVLGLSAEPDFENPTDANGDNRFEVRVAAKDESGGVSFDNRTITITDVNEAPVANAAAASGDIDTVILGALTASDPDGDTLTFTEASGPANGALMINVNGSFLFTPDADYSGTDSLLSGQATERCPTRPRRPSR